jgi:hypothetical protein
VTAAQGKDLAPCFLTGSTCNSSIAAKVRFVSQVQDSTSHHEGQQPMHSRPWHQDVGSGLQAADHSRDPEGQLFVRAVNGQLKRRWSKCAG